MVYFCSFLTPSLLHSMLHTSIRRRCCCCYFLHIMCLSVSVRLGMDCACIVHFTSIHSLIARRAIYVQHITQTLELQYLYACVLYTRILFRWLCNKKKMKCNVVYLPVSMGTRCVQCICMHIYVAFNIISHL